MPELNPTEICPSCGDPLIPGKLYCANCGLSVLSESQRVLVDTYVRAKVDQAIAGRLVNQKNVVRDIADKAEDVVWKRVKRYTWAAGIVGLLLSVYGISSIHEAKTKIIEEARSRLEPVVAKTEERISAIQGKLGDSEQQIVIVKKKLDGVSALADQQNRRLTVQGGEIGKKLREVQEANRKADILSTGFENRVAGFADQLNAMQTRAAQSNLKLEDMQKKLDEMQKSFDTQMVAVSRQVDNVSVHEAFPGLGQKIYVTYNNKPWRGKAGKNPGEKWVGIFIATEAWPIISNKQVEDLEQTLRKIGFTPLAGRFGIGGPYSSGFGSLGDNSQAVYYYNEKDKQAASEVAKAVKENLNLPEMPIKFIDPSKVDPSMRPVLEQSGLDMQIFISTMKR